MRAPIRRDRRGAAPRARGAHPLLGHLPSYRADPFGFIEGCVREHGEFVRLRFGPLPALLTTNHEAAAAVLVDEAPHYRKRGQLYQVLSRFLGDGPLVNDGDVWQRQRALLEPAFDRARLEAREPCACTCVQRWTGGVAEGEERDVARDMAGLATDAVARVLFDADLSGDDLAELEEAYRVGADELYRLGTGVGQLAPQAVPLPANRRLRSAARRLDAVVDRVIAGNRVAGNRGGRPPVLLGHPDGLDGRAGRDLVVNLLSSARETGITLAWAWALLARHHDALDRLEAEVDAALAGRFPTSGDLPALVTTRAVVQETLRLYPAGPLIARRAARPGTVGGHPVRKGTIVFVSPWVMHRDPRHFADPERFVPERWTDGLADRLPPFAYLPFGAGPRACVARAFAPRLCALLLAGLAQELRFALDPDRPVRPAPGFAPRPAGGLKMTVRRRRA